MDEGRRVLRLLRPSLPRALAAGCRAAHYIALCYAFLASQLVEQYTVTPCCSTLGATSCNFTVCLQVAVNRASGVRE